MKLIQLIENLRKAYTSNYSYIKVSKNCFAIIDKRYDVEVCIMLYGDKELFDVHVVNTCGRYSKTGLTMHDVEMLVYDEFDFNDNQLEDNE